MKANPLKRLKELGQTVWLDYLRRDLVTSGQLKEYIEQDGLSGITSTHANFDKAIAGSGDYDDDIRKLTAAGKDAKAIYEAIMLQDVQLAADEFRQLYDKTDCQDGYVSLKVDSYLAHDTQGTVVEARRLWAAVNRPNIFIKVPATPEGCSAIKQLISEGINVNATLLFSLRDYQQVIDAYLAGIETRLSQGMPVNRVASVASFYLSDIDELFDPILEKLIIDGGDKAELAMKMQGQVAISIAKSAYQILKETIDSAQFERLVDKGACVQRLVWTNLDTKNPKSSDIKYIESLIGPNTITAISTETLDSFRDHGDPIFTIEKDKENAEWITHQLSNVHVNIDIVTQQLVCKGIEKFDQSYDKLIEALEKASSQP